MQGASVPSRDYRSGGVELQKLGESTRYASNNGREHSEEYAKSFQSRDAGRAGKRSKVDESKPLGLLEIMEYMGSCQGIIQH